MLSSVVAIVSGGASGLGLATARRLAAQGASVVIADLASSNGTQVAEELGSSCIFSPTDVTDEAQIQDTIASAVSSFGKVNTLVNCAGVAFAMTTFGKKGPHDMGTFETTFKVNVLGTFNLTRLTVAQMCSQEEDGEERGVIINTASVAAMEGQVGQVAYAASKGAIVSMTLPMARDLARYKIRVNTIAPGLFDTALLAGLPEKVKADLAQEVPFPKRLGNPDEYAQLVQSIVENKMINGETIRIDGAIRMKA